MRYQNHRSDPSILGRRTLEQDHRHLAPRIESGMQVLDVGCGTGAITAGIAEKVGPTGRVIGIDLDESLIAIARQQNPYLRNLDFVHGDALAMPYENRFDIVTAARALQWMADPLAVLRSMKRAAKPGGLIVVLDYNHVDNKWEPEPPAEFKRFYDAFLNWRADNGWDNRMADRLPALFTEAGITEARSLDANEISVRGEKDFAVSTAIWARVLTTISPRIVDAGFLKAAESAAAAEQYSAYAVGKLATQTLQLRSVEGRA